MKLWITYYVLFLMVQGLLIVWKEILLPSLKSGTTRGINVPATGIVSDEEGYPLPGVNVVISDLQRFAITDNNGKYNIEIPFNTACTITFSYIGMSTQQMMINSGRNDVRRKYYSKK